MLWRMAGRSTAVAAGGLTWFVRPDRKALIRLRELCLPAMGGMLLMTLVGVVDLKMVGELVPENVKTGSITALVLNRTLMWVINSFLTGFGVAATAFVSQAKGSGDMEKVRVYGTLTMFISACFALAITMVGLLVGPWMLSLLGAEASVEALTWDYLNLILIGMLVFSTNFVSMNIFNALGQTQMPFYSQLILNAVNVVVNWIMIPHWGVAGAALATLLSTTAVVVFYLWQLRAQKLLTGLRKVLKEPLGPLMGQVIPGSLMMVLRSLSMLALYKIIALVPESLGDTTVGMAALGVGIQVESLSFIPTFAFSVAAATMVGQALGAGDIERANRGCSSAVLVALCFMCVMATLFITFPEELVNFFASRDASILPEGVNYILINAIGVPAIGMCITLSGGLRGAGDVRSVTAIVLIAQWGVRLPLAWYLAVPGGMGFTGVWIAQALTCWVEFTLLSARWISGRWTLKKLV